MQKSKLAIVSALVVACAVAPLFPLHRPGYAAAPSAPASEINFLTPTRIRADFLKLIDRPSVPLNPTIAQGAAADPNNPGATLFHIAFTSAPNERVTGILLTPAPPNAAGAPPAAAKRPVVILLHGTGGKKEDELPLMRQLAAKNFLTVAIDAPFHGERSPTGSRRTNGFNAYERAVLDAYHNNVIPIPGTAAADPQIQNQKSKIKNGYPFFYDTVTDVMRLIDYLQTRDDVDPARIGLYGVSKGGIETYLTAAVDLRIAAAVPCISVESFRWADEHDMWQHRIETIQPAFDAAWKEFKAANANAPEKPDPAFVQRFYDRINPGITAEFDGPSMIQLIAPRALLAINGELDPRTPPESLKLCTDAAHSAYHAQNADEKFQLLIQPATAHKVTAAAEETAIEFFTKWLNPQR